MIGGLCFEDEEIGVGVYSLVNVVWDNIVGVVEVYVWVVSGFGGVVGCFILVVEEVWEVGEVL